MTINDIRELEEKTARELKMRIGTDRDLNLEDK